MRITVAAALVAIGAALALPGIASAAVGAGQPFPTNLHTLKDRTQATGLRINLPKPANAGLNNFHENIPLRGLPPVTATPDETAIQQLIDRSEWAQQSANPAAYAPYVRAPVIYQFARGDQTVPNPTTSAILRACGCADRATLFRNDLAFAVNPLLPKNPHQFLTQVALPAAAPFAFAAHQQIATFLASDGATTIDPDGAAPFFETPTSMVPEDLAFIP